ncbi:MAG: hypothetical protein H0T51_23835 [Pirellulales bacterium]|nr:hypothetical protein [Pirellulales bacterium]
MLFQQRGACAALLVLSAVTSRPLLGQEVKYEDGADGIRYQVTRQVIQRQVPVQVMKDQQQTTYRQQVTTENVQHQQVYNVPVTQYRIVSRLNGRWNPFVQPYWTHHYEPVTTWQQQVGTVQIPVTRVSVAPETHTVQVATTEYRTANEEVFRKVAVGAVPSAAPNTAWAARTPATAGPSATIAPLAGSTAAASIATRPIGGEKMESDIPRTSTGTSRY